jgi:hypothetical protein
VSVSLRHVLSQGPVIAALARTAAAAALRKPAATSPATPGPWLEAVLPPRPADLVRDYIRHVGGDPAWYRGVLPPSFFPQWSFPLAARTLDGVAYPLARVLNAGCRLELREPIPAGEPLHVRARLESIDDDGRRAILTQRVVTGTARVPEALVADMRVFVPLERKNGARKPAATVPSGARELAFFSISKSAGLDFAKLTGDFNPVHWIPSYARASGLRGTILHGFSTLARAIEALDRRVFAGDVRRLETIDVRFTGPLLLPARAGVYLDGGDLYVGDAPSGRAFLQGSFTTRKEPLHG